MKKTIAALATVSALTLCVFTAPASAGEFYLGASVGQSKIDAGNCDDVDDGSLISCSVDDSDIGYKVYGGYQFTPHVAVEGGYVTLGETTITANSDGSGPVWPAGALEGKGEAKGFLLQGVFGGTSTKRSPSSAVPACCSPAPTWRLPQAGLNSPKAPATRKRSSAWAPRSASTIGSRCEASGNASWTSAMKILARATSICCR